MLPTLYLPPTTPNETETMTTIRRIRISRPLVLLFIAFALAALASIIVAKYTGYNPGILQIPVTGK